MIGVLNIFISLFDFGHFHKSQPIGSILRANMKKSPFKRLRFSELLNKILSVPDD